MYFLLQTHHFSSRTSVFLVIYYLKINKLCSLPSNKIYKKQDSLLLIPFVNYYSKASKALSNTP